MTKIIKLRDNLTGNVVDNVSTNIKRHVVISAISEPLALSPSVRFVVGPTTSFQGIAVLVRIVVHLIHMKIEIHNKQNQWNLSFIIIQPCSV